MFGRVGRPPYTRPLLQQRAADHSKDHPQSSTALAASQQCPIILAAKIRPVRCLYLEQQLGVSFRLPRPLHENHGKGIRRYHEATLALLREISAMRIGCTPIPPEVDGR